MMNIGMILILVGSSPLIFYILLTICEYRINKKYGISTNNWTDKMLKLNQEGGKHKC